MNTSTDFHIKPLSTKTKNKLITSNVTVPEIDQTVINKIWWYNKLEILFDQGFKKGFLKNVIVHGSYGDMTSTNYSDLDLTLYIDEQIFQNRDLMNSFRNWYERNFFTFMLSVDPLQHHGPFYLWDSLISNYSEDILPIEVYRRSWGLKKIEMNFRHFYSDFSPETKALSLITCESLLNHKKFFRHGHNMYQMKRYLSNLMLIPAFYYTDVGCPMHKADSFDFFYKEFGDLADPIKEASKIRINWPKTPSLIRELVLVSRKLPFTSKITYISRLGYNNKNIKDNIYENIVPGILPLYHELENRLQK
ncbi:hypothetical protein ACSAZK_06080 [Methanosarcina sp. Mfa9]|uniref:hypothetical protein n=1 Tax=Methanosarcina sp. Mfa9 TaxID=3439063 RepID=UPI003F871677